MQFTMRHPDAHTASNSALDNTALTRAAETIERTALHSPCQTAGGRRAKQRSDVVAVKCRACTCVSKQCRQPECRGSLATGAIVRPNCRSRAKTTSFIHLLMKLLHPFLVIATCR